MRGGHGRVRFLSPLRLPAILGRLTHAESNATAELNDAAQEGQAWGFIVQLTALTCMPTVAQAQGKATMVVGSSGSGAQGIGHGRFVRPAEFPSLLDPSRHCPSTPSAPLNQPHWLHRFVRLALHRSLERAVVFDVASSHHGGSPLFLLKFPWLSPSSVGLDRFYSCAACRSGRCRVRCECCTANSLVFCSHHGLCIHLCVCRS